MILINFLKMSKFLLKMLRYNIFKQSKLDRGLRKYEKWFNCISLKLIFLKLAFLDNGTTTVYFSGLVVAKITHKACVDLKGTNMSGIDSTNFGWKAR